MCSLENIILDWVGSINYSVLGYESDERWSSLDKEVASAFKQISVKAMEIAQGENRNIVKFISFADTELNAEKIEEWEVEPDKGRFYYSFCDSKLTNELDVDQVNDYYFFKYVLSKTMEDGEEKEKKLLGNPKSAQLAYILKEPFVYRIRCYNSREPSLNYFVENKTLEVSIPQKWLEWQRKERPIDGRIKDIEYHRVKYDPDHCVYESEAAREKNNSIYDSSRANIDTLKKNIKKLSKLVSEKNVPIKEEPTKEPIYHEGFARLLLSLAYLAMKKSCTVESIPGPVAEKNGEVKCLGVFIWGYEGEGASYTPYFKLLADKLCICFAAKYIKPLRYVDKIKLASINSAVAEIMSRNMSHNLGSHYLYYTKNQLALLADKIHSMFDTVHLTRELANKVDNLGPEIRGAAKVLAYMQARMDYLATIVSGEKYPYGGVFVKGQIFDELTIDDFSKRHFSENKDISKRTTNYLLRNIILSENFTRESVDKGSKKRKTSRGIVRLQVILPNGKVFKGVTDNEHQQKLDFSKLNVAMPGGVMSVHAFFNVVENLIRNSAKYLKDDFNRDEGLVFTIKVNKYGPHTKESSGDFPVYEFIIFDNKENALRELDPKTGMTLLGLMNTKIQELQVLDRNQALDKSDKGIKEMLFSVLWMRSYTYYAEKNSLAEVLLDIDSLPGEQKLKKIRECAFEFVAVDDNGKVLCSYCDNKELPEKANLGIRFCLPEFRMMEVAEESVQTLLDKIRNNFTDLICIHEPPTAQLRKHITRIYYDKDNVFHKVNEKEPANAVVAFRKILNERFGDIDRYQLIIGSKKEKGANEADFDNKNYGIYFRTHLGNDWNKDKKEMEWYAYSEAISGGNFTKTIESLFRSSIDISTNEYKDDEGRYFGLKIKEASLTRITLIDERFFKDMMAGKNKKEILKFKNIRILNLKAKAPSRKKVITNGNTVLFDGGDFHDGKDATHFLSIHLGMIEKIVGNEKWSKAFGIEKETDRAKALMKELRQMFKTEKDEVFISVHSGRGNFSKELETSLRNYPFINVSALENVLGNSKYLLAQLFYNNVYNYDE